jgi:hypothetical protein
MRLGLSALGLAALLSAAVTNRASGQRIESPTSVVTRYLDDMMHGRGMSAAATFSPRGLLQMRMMLMTLVENHAKHLDLRALFGTGLEQLRAASDQEVVGRYLSIPALAKLTATQRAQLSKVANATVLGEEIKPDGIAYVLVRQLVRLPGTTSVEQQETLVLERTHDGWRTTMPETWRAQVDAVISLLATLN